MVDEFIGNRRKIQLTTALFETEHPLGNNNTVIFISLNCTFIASRLAINCEEKIRQHLVNEYILLLQILISRDC